MKAFIVRYILLKWTMSQRKIKKLKKLDLIKVNKSTEIIESFVTTENSFFEIIKNNRIFLIVLLFGTFLLYLNGMAGAFVSDDYATIPNNPTVKDVTNMMGDVFSFVTLSNSVLANIFGVGSPVPYHLYSLLVYLIICLLVFVFTYLLLGKEKAYITSIIFAVMPIHVEAVTWISGKPYILTSIFMMASLCNIMLYFKTKNKNYIFWLVLFEILALLTEKVRFMSLFLVMVGYVMAYGQRHKINIGKFLLVIVGLFAVSLAVIYPFIMNRINIVNGGINGSGSIFYDPFFQYPTAIAKYLQLLFVPFDLTLYHTMYIFPTWLNWAILLSYLTCIVYFYFKNKDLFFSLVFIFLAAAPSMAPVKVSWLVAERYMFFGSLGFAMFMGIVIYNLSKYFKLAAPVFFVSIVIIYGVRTFTRNLDWTTNHNLWVNTCQVSPNSHNAWNNIGDDYDKLKEFENAIKGFTQSTIVKPNYADAYHNRANIFYKVGRFDLARESYDTALRLNPGLYQTYMSLIQIDLNEKRHDLVLDHVNKLLAADPNNVQSHYVAGIVYAQIGNIDQAINKFKEILVQYPNYTLARNALTELQNKKSGL